LLQLLNPNLPIRRIETNAPEFPARLRQAVNPPEAIFVTGALRPEDDYAVAMIGSRDCSLESAQRARKYAGYLVSQGLVIVSGYATGVDLNAHLGALQAGGRTIIIPGCSLDRFDFHPLYSVNLRSLSDLGERALLISELPERTDWSVATCLARNRLVAAQARALLVLEAQIGSSTLNTVEHGLQLGRPVFAQTLLKDDPRGSGNAWLLASGKAQAIANLKSLDAIIEVVKLAQ